MVLIALNQVDLVSSEVDTGEPHDDSASLQVAYSGNSQDTKIDYTNSLSMKIPKLVRIPR